MDKNRRKRGDLKRVKPYNVITIIFSILGIIVGFGVLLIIRG
jgi:LPS O-antigen subunit length determinant protein (WzzB/FepE family)